MQFSKALLTPSDEVDQVWHFHIANSRYYFERSQALIGELLHHNPTSGDKAEDQKFIVQYNYTLFLYEKVLS